MSTRYNTGNPIESTDVRDMSDNAKNLDLFSSSSELSFDDRFGVERKTIHGMNSEFDGMIVGMNSEFDAQILNIGFTRVGTFLSGATLTNPRQTLLWDIADGGDGQEYGWSGTFPKIVPPSSTPSSTGGIAVGAWMSRFDPELRVQVREALRRSYAEAGYNLVDGSFEAGGTLVNANDVLLQERTGKAFSGPAGTVAAGTNPASGMFVDKSGGLLRHELATENGSEKIGFGRGGSLPLSTIYAKLLKAYELSEFGKSSETVSNLQGVTGVTPSDKVQLVGYFSGSRIGGGEFIWRGDLPKTKHDGGLFIDPNKTFPVDWATGAAAWFSSVGAVGNGVWQRVYDGKYILAEWFGAEPWVIGGAQDSTLSFQQASNVAGRGGTWRWVGRHRTTSYVSIPAKQTFGSFSQASHVYSELFNPTNFQGVHVGVDPSLSRTITSAVFYDSDTGEAFRCEEGAIPENFLLYGRGYNSEAYGASLSTALPPESAYLATSGIRHSKYITPKNVTVVLFKYPFDSNPWNPASKGDYYTKYTNCVMMYCFCIWRVSIASGEPTFNTKHINSRAYVNKVVENSYATRNVVFIGGSIEGFNSPSLVRAGTGLSFKGTYFETLNPANTVVFNVMGWCAINFENCLGYMNNVTKFVTTGGETQTAGVTAISLTGHGNVWHRADGASGLLFDVDGVVKKSIGIYGDIINLSAGSSLGYYAGRVPAGVYVEPITQTY